jgi:outer membrane protein OmpA-like peptidoglycan-associated protein
MGNGRMALSLSTQWYMQQKPYVNTPNMHAQIYTGIVALSYGLTHSITLFVSQAGFASKDYTDAVDTKGWGSFKTGVQVAVPLPDNWFIHLAGQAAVYGGTSKNQINNNVADGYNYFETRTKYDVSGKLLQTVCFGNADIGLKIHLNESGVWNVKSPENSLLVMAAGAQGNIGRLALGIECNSRTFMKDINLTSDPLWFTPTLYFRTPFQINISAGADISLSGNRPAISQPGRIFEDPAFQNSYYSPRALEPYRLFASISYSINFKKNDPYARLTPTQREVIEKAALSRKAALADTLQEKAISDSLVIVETKQKLETEQAKLAEEQAKLADEQAKLAEEQAKLTSTQGQHGTDTADAEKQLRTTGMLLLSSVYFTPGRTEITINSKSYLNVIAKVLLKLSTLKIQIEGHTDNVGNPNLNYKLSKGRAESVLRYLLKVEPLLKGRLTAVGYGKTRPKADNRTAEGREINRRVQLHVIN